MNKQEFKTENVGKWRVFNEKTKNILLFALLAFSLLFAAWKVFYPTGNASQNVLGMSECELKISRLLEEMEGVGKANVAICETEEGVESVVVVCEGAKNFQVVLNVREAVATALGIEEKAIKIYLKE